jgi:DMSO/TMAO reductase YedYZ molybdopterin-dependent catalytic subunit
MPQAIATATQNTSFLTITNITSATVNLSYDELFALPKITVYAELYCFGNPVTAGYWSGVKFTDLFSLVGDIDEKVRSIDLQAEDGYRVGVPIETAIRPDVIIAYEKNEVLLPEKLRLVIPDANGDVWIAMIASMEMSTQELPASLSADSALGPIDSILSYSRQQPTQPPPTTTMQPNPEESIKPELSPPNSAQPEVAPENQTTKPPNVGAPFQNLTVELSYMIMLALISVIVATFLVFFHRKKPRN